MVQSYLAFTELMYGLPMTTRRQSSLAEDAMNLDIFKVATPADIIKFVVGSMQDLDRMNEILKHILQKRRFSCLLYGAILKGLRSLII